MVAYKLDFFVLFVHLLIGIVIVFSKTSALFYHSRFNGFVSTISRVGLNGSDILVSLQYLFEI